jgi:hypothetical protein
MNALLCSCLHDNGTWSDPFTLTITILTSPKDGASTTSGRPTFKWAKAQEATGYRLQVDNNPDFTTPEIDVPLTARKYRPDTPPPVGNCFWRVQVITGTANSTWMPAWTLTITPKPPARPKLLAPAKNAHTNNTASPFSWWAVSDGHTYQLQVDTDRRFRTPEVEV